MEVLNKVKLLVWFSLFVITLVSCSRHLGLNRVNGANYALPGQTAPPDMILVEGNDSIEPFYISVIEEPNINYIIYLKYLAEVYSLTPVVFAEALPMATDDDGTHINEPFLTNYMTNPYCAYYPVTNLSWLQIQRYLEWKTDRLNESILIKTGMIANTADESYSIHTFSTEAFLTGAFSPPRVLHDEILNSGPALFTGYRLPTKNEWMLANGMSLTADHDIRKYRRRANYRPFGNDYFLFDFELAPINGPNYDRLNLEDRGDIITYQVNKNAIGKQQISISKELDSTVKHWMTIIDDYPVNGYGLFNMPNGVGEWLLNDSAHIEANWLEAYEESGFSVDSQQFGTYILNLEAHPLIDSFGRAAYFRYIDVDSNGRYIQVAHEADYDTIKVNLSDTLKLRQMGFGQFVRYACKIPSLEFPVYNKRAYITGTWDSPGTKVKYKFEHHSAHNIGFRCVLPYTGLPVEKRFKVKWYVTGD